MAHQQARDHSTSHKQRLHICGQDQWPEGRCPIFRNEQYGALWLNEALALYQCHYRRTTSTSTRGFTMSSTWTKLRGSLGLWAMTMTPRVQKLPVKVRFATLVVAPAAEYPKTYHHRPNLRRRRRRITTMMRIPRHISNKTALY